MSRMSVGWKNSVSTTCKWWCYNRQKQTHLYPIAMLLLSICHIALTTNLYHTNHKLIAKLQGHDVMFYCDQMWTMIGLPVICRAIPPRIKNTAPKEHKNRASKKLRTNENSLSEGKSASLAWPVVSSGTVSAQLSLFQVLFVGVGPVTIVQCTMKQAE